MMKKLRKFHLSFYEYERLTMKVENNLSNWDI
jgi:hypothetical protein